MTPISEKKPTFPKAIPLGRHGVFRFSIAQFLGALILMFIGSPFVMLFHDGDLIETVLLMFVLFSGILAAGGTKRTLLLALILATPAVAGKWINHYRPDLLPLIVFHVAILVFFVFMVAHLLRFIFRSPRVNGEVFCAAVSAYLMLGLSWTFAYLIVARLIPDSFAFSVGPAANRQLDPVTAFYFSFVTLCTVGFGDVTPVSSLARMLTVMEAITGTLYMALLIARLVALYSSAAQPEGRSRRAAPAGKTTEPTITKPES
jgi:hypothetical protein